MNYLQSSVNLSLINQIQISSLPLIVSIITVLLIILSGILFFRKRLRKLNEMLKSKESENAKMDGEM
jgi:hypothetical protein